MNTKNELELKDAIIDPHNLVMGFLKYHESLDEEGKEKLWKRLDMDNYDPKEMEPEAFKKRLDEQTLQMKRELDPEGPYMQSIFNEFDEYISILELPWWKRVMVKVGVVKR